MSDTDATREATVRHVAELEEEAVLDVVQTRLAQGDDPLQIVEDCQEGLRQVGLRYEKQQYFLAGLIMAGEIFREVMELVQPAIEGLHQGEEQGRILLGTVEGDIHDIGKNNLSMLLGCYGFTVLDLGVDVSPAHFLQEAKRLKPDVIGLSGLLTSSYDAMQKTIDLIRNCQSQELSELPVIIGGGQISEEVYNYVGADYWVTDAMVGVRICQRLLSENR